MSRQESSISNIMTKYSAVASKMDSNLPLVIERYSKISKNTFKLYASHKGEFANGNDYNESVLAFSDNRISVVPGTILNIPGSLNSTVISMIVTANTNTIAYNEETAKGMTLVTANVFQDESDNIWKLSGEGDAKSLVQVSNDDIEGILKKRLSQRVTANTNLDIDLTFNNGDYIAYYNTDKMVVSCGYGLYVDEKASVYDRESDALIFINPESVVEVASDLPEEVQGYNETATLTAAGAAKQIEYFRKIYGNTAFFAKFEALIKQRLGMGPDGKFMRLTKKTSDGLMC